MKAAARRFLHGRWLRQLGKAVFDLMVSEAFAAGALRRSLSGLAPLPPARPTSRDVRDEAVTTCCLSRVVVTGPSGCPPSFCASGSTYSALRALRPLASRGRGLDPGRPSLSSQARRSVPPPDARRLHADHTPNRSVPRSCCSSHSYRELARRGESPTRSLAGLEVGGDASVRISSRACGRRRR